MEKTPWIPLREYNICCWGPVNVRGQMTNENASLFSDIYKFTDEQIDAYVKMMGECGFNGIQLIDNCYLWRVSSTPQHAHDILKKFIKAAKKYGQHVTLWVWAACFDHHGWHDSRINVDLKGGSAYDNKEKFEIYNYYYDIYAELADDVDMLIAHYYDPGELKVDDAIKFFTLLRDKFKAKNPNIEFALDTWGAPADYEQKLIDSGLKGCMLMELSWLERMKPGMRAEFRKHAVEKGFTLGIWGWYTAEYESDQLTSMIVNAHVLKDVYTRIREEGDKVARLRYWSEMEATHVYNLFSMYCAGQLLIDPDRDPDELIMEIATKVFGKKYAKVAFEALKLLEDGRSGHKWETFWWRYDECVLKQNLGIEFYNRAKKVCDDFENIIVAADDLENTISLPHSPKIIAKMMLPHLKQVELLAKFKVDFEILEEKYKNGESKEELSKYLDGIFNPIPDFNVWFGMFSTLERRQQLEMVYDFCQKAEIEMPCRPFLRQEHIRRCIEKMILFQRGKTKPYKFKKNTFFLTYNRYDNYEVDEIVKYFLDSKIVTPCEDDPERFILTNWDEYIYDFNI